MKNTRGVHLFSPKTQFYQNSYFIYVSREGSGESVYVCRDALQGTKIFQYCTYPAGLVTNTIFTRPANTCTCPLEVYAIKNIRE